MAVLRIKSYQGRFCRCLIHAKLQTFHLPVTTLPLKRSLPQLDVISQTFDQTLNWRNSANIYTAWKAEAGGFCVLGGVGGNVTQGGVALEAVQWGELAHGWDVDKVIQLGFWDWVDKALDQVCKKYRKQPAAINQYFQSVIEEDKKLFSKAVGKVVSSEERNDWQQQIKVASSLLPIANS
ncbi:hypothetical protein B0J17DRAFT_635213 [Rhizoctonia solani]|nr:hypothetical protein B0J17DRAFT_635213 [Rhizoctonia solani]